jgi:uncharacterized protein (DUF433 family)
MDIISERITIDDEICNGKPVVEGTRITVNTILEFLSAGDSPDDIIKEYPSLTKEDISACLKFAAEISNRHFTLKKVA